MHVLVLCTYFGTLHMKYANGQQTGGSYTQQGINMGRGINIVTTSQPGDPSTNGRYPQSNEKDETHIPSFHVDPGADSIKQQACSK